MTKALVSLVVSAAILVTWHVSFTPKIGGVFWVIAFAIIAGSVWILISLAKKFYNTAKTFSKKTILICASIVTIVVAGICFEIGRLPLMRWSGYIFSSKYNAEGNYLDLGTFPSKESCISSSKAAIAQKQTIELSNHKELGKIEIDSYLCGRFCMFPDGPGNVTIGEIDCSSMTRETVKQ